MTSCPSRSSCWPTSCGSTGARTSRRSTGARPLLKERFPDGTYVDVPGLCKVATLAEIEAQGGASTPVATRVLPPSTTTTRTSSRSSPSLYDEFTRLSDEADELRAKVDAAIQGILDA